MFADPARPGFYAAPFGPYEIPDVVSPMGRSRDGARQFVNFKKSKIGVRLPRIWGNGAKAVLRWSGGEGGPKKQARRMKAHDALVMFQSGMFGVLAAWPRDVDDTPNLLAPIVGDLTIIIRELTSPVIIPNVCPPYLALLFTFYVLEVRARVRDASPTDVPFRDTRRVQMTRSARGTLRPHTHQDDV